MTPPTDPAPDAAAGDAPGDAAGPDGPPPRDPRQVRFWGWIAFAAAVVIVVVGLFVGRPWRSCHCPVHKGSLDAPVVVLVRPAGT